MTGNFETKAQNLGMSFAREAAAVLLLQYESLIRHLHRFSC